MQKLSWNNDLAILVQNWLNQCPDNNQGMIHDEYSNRNFPKLTVGQNLSVRSFTGFLEPQNSTSLLRRTIEEWYSYKDKIPNIKKWSKKEYGDHWSMDLGPEFRRFTQLLWATTNQVYSYRVFKGQVDFFDPYPDQSSTCS